MNKNYKEVSSSIMDAAKSISELEEELQTRVNLASRAVSAHTEASSTLVDVCRRKKEAVNLSSSTMIDELPSNYDEEKHHMALTIINQIEKYDSMITKVNDITANIKAEIELTNKEISEIESNNEVINAEYQKVVESINTINDFVDSKLFADATNALDALKNIIEKDSCFEKDNNDEEQSESAIDSNIDNNKDVTDIYKKYEAIPTERKIEYAKKTCPFLNGSHDINDDKDDYDCSNCDYYHSCPMNNCDDNLDCKDCEYYQVCPLRYDYPSDTTDDDDEDITDNQLDDYNEQYEVTKQGRELSGLSLVDLVSPLGTARQFNIDLQNAVEDYCTVSKSEFNDLPSKIKDFVSNIKELGKVLVSLSDAKSNPINEIYNFYNSLFSNTINMMLGDGLDDESRISLQENDVNNDAVSEILDAVDEFTDDLINDEPSCDVFQFDMTGDFKVVSTMDIDGFNETFEEYHKESIEFLKENKAQLEKVLYGINFTVFADNDINDSLKNISNTEFNESKYYTINIPSPVLNKYEELYCSSDEDNSGFDYIKSLFNSMNRFSYNIDSTVVRKYIIAQILSAMPIEAMIYKTTIESDKFNSDEPTTNDDIVNDIFVSTGYDEMKIINIVIRDELNKLDTFKSLGDECLSEDDTKTIQQDVCELVYQIWFNQICKLLFNNDDNKVDDVDLIPNYTQGLVMDTQPITNMHPVLTKHVKPIELLITTSMLYTNELIALNDSTEYDITHTLGNLVMRIGTDVKSNITLGQRLDYDVMYKIWLAVKEKTELKD